MVWLGELAISTHFLERGPGAGRNVKTGLPALQVLTSGSGFACFFGVYFPFTPFPPFPSFPFPSFPSLGLPPFAASFWNPPACGGRGLEGLPAAVTFFGPGESERGLMRDWASTYRKKRVRPSESFSLFFGSRQLVASPPVQ